MLQPDIDQFTLVLQPTFNLDFDDWREWAADHLIERFLMKSKMPMLFGYIDKSDVTLPEGYTVGYSFTNAPFYFCIAYHEAFIKMGIIIKFSAYAWSEYRSRYEETFDEPMHLHTFFKMIEAQDYSFRLSRIDTCCDFFNENIDVAGLKRSIEQGRTEIRYGKY